MPSGHRHAGIDLLRAGCIIYIVGFWHLLGYSTAAPGYVNPVTTLATVVVLGTFVMISGFLTGLRASHTNPSIIFLFYIDKFIRIYPPYICAVAAFYFLGLSTPLVLARSAVFLSMFSAPAPPTLWFVAMLAIFYLVSPLLSRLATNLPGFTAASALATGAVWLLGLRSENLDLRLAIYFPAFAAGFLLARRTELRPYLKVRLLALPFLFSLPLAYASTASTAESSITSLPLAITGPAFCLAVVGNADHAIGRHRIISQISYAAYFMYLFHRPIYHAMKEFYFPASAVWQILYLTGACLPLLLFASYAAQTAYDRAIKGLRIRPASA